MIHAIIWLTILGIALLVPNVLAIRFALLGAGDAPAAVAGNAPAAGAADARPAVVRPIARPKAKRSSPEFVRRAYLWKALSPLIFGVCVVLGLAIGDLPGYLIMGAGLLNMIYGLIGWDAYIPGKTGKQQ